MKSYGDNQETASEARSQTQREQEYMPEPKSDPDSKPAPKEERSFWEKLERFIK